MRYDTIRYNTMRYDAIRYDTIRYDTIRYNTKTYENINPRNKGSRLHAPHHLASFLPAEAMLLHDLLHVHCWLFESCAKRSADTSIKEMKTYEIQLHAISRVLFDKWQFLLNKSTEFHATNFK